MEQVLIKQQSESNLTDKAYGKLPEQRTIEELLESGIINLNKQPGPSSHQTADYIKKVLHIRKAGHSGTLDPKVTGVLPVALGKATRIAQFLLLSDKEYVGIACFHKEISEEKIKEEIKNFLGQIEQLPPVRSAVKRELRKRMIYEFELLEFSGRLMLFRVKCQAGTYIRKLISDLGRHLGIGAHMLELIRTKAGPFTCNDWITLHQISEAYYLWKQEGKDELLKRYLLPVECAVQNFKKIWITDKAVGSICYGAPLAVPGVCRLNPGIKKDEWVAVLSLKDELVCMGKAQMSSEEILDSKKGIAVSNTKVFMEKDTYPKG
ncbi:RNA-guided pseudouridylation complex pseudouridine synthase subunit Cbf5 [archaeon]|nr:RNA-guided pseudouridylation complex pseudouridine synthase subunit Cbf5 [archaeon]